MASTSGANKTPFPAKEAASGYHPYPAPLAKYEDIVADPRLFMHTLEKLHTSMGTKFMYALSISIDHPLDVLYSYQTLQD